MSLLTHFVSTVASSSAAAGPSPRSRLQGAQGGRQHTTEPVWAPAELRVLWATIGARADSISRGCVPPR